MFEKQIKRLNMWDWIIVKVSVVTFILFLLRIWPGFINWLQNRNAWWFLAITIILVAIIQYKVWKK
ncbi:hypothetical protein J4446_02765 [Candidatus Woesearchaeota archaeon]|nr:hypothetical protein [Candidatus Woesearchaeota archaeon]